MDCTPQIENGVIRCSACGRVFPHGSDLKTRARCHINTHCIYLGQLKHEILIKCETCQGNVRQKFKVHGCKIYGECLPEYVGQTEGVPQTCFNCTKCKRVRNMNWAYGITTVPSRVENGLLAQTVYSLANAGFDLPTLFIDGGCECLLGLPIVINCPAIGHLANWLRAIVHLYAVNPNADAYVLFEDDLIACPNLREYLERAKWPEKGYLNLLTHDSNYELIETLGPGWWASNQRGRGAVGLVFTQQAVRDLITSQEFVNRPKSPHNCADGMVIEALKPLGYVEYVHNPSLVQHMGLTSTLPLHEYGKMKAYSEGFDPLTLLSEKL